MVTVRSRRGNAVFRAIADPTRRQILGLLRDGHHTVGEIAANFRTSRPAISKHLRLLRAAGLVTTQKQGAARICRLNAKPLAAVDAWLRDYQAFWGASMRSLKDYIEGTKPHKEGRL
ncbi:MAG TPA: metalloregulator ArsR/SmtB family transcription factor [Bryobacteraceae bacterium]|nr:metalloregulator ArsR/SmtB family transcription factor [Bryobacteraceae bacterium]